MAEMIFEGSCPCGDSVKVSGYPSEVKLQIQAWRSIHTRHSNRIAKAVETEMLRSPSYTSWGPTTSTTIPYTTTITTNTGNGAD